jgi:hypothetical protein
MVPISAVGAAPAAVRDRVLSEATVGTASGGRGWRSDGFPVADPGARRPAVLAAVAAVLVVLAVVGLVAVIGDDGDDLAAIDAAVSTATAAPTTTASTTTTAAPAAAPTPPTTAVAPPTTAAPTPTTTVAPPAPAPPSTTVTTTVEPGPQIELQFVPRVLYHPTPGFASCGASTEVVAVAAASAARVELWWRDPSGADGTVPMTSGAAEWRGVVELPEQLAGPATLVAVAYDAQGRTGVSATTSVPVRACPTPG